MEFLSQSVEELKAFARSKNEEYVTADPFPNIYFDNFFIPEKLKEVLAEFPDLTKGAAKADVVQRLLLDELGKN